MQINIINLSTGLEFLPDIIPHGYSRFQSSQLESKAWQKFFDSIDNNMLYHLSKGNCVVLHDCGSRRSDGCPRTIWQGIPFIKHVLSRCWNLENEAFFKTCNVTKYIDSLKIDSTKAKYYRKHLDTKEVNLIGVYKKSLIDGK